MYPDDTLTGSKLSLKRLFLRASSWTLFGYGANMVIRLSSHLILARLLVPEDFGIMQLVFAFIGGLNMFSDLGLSQNIIQHERGEEPSFLQTAWTIQILRGFIIWFITLIIAWPIAKIYSAPQIAWLLPLIGISAIITGTISTKFVLLQRHMQFGKLTLVDFISLFIGITAMLACAWKWRTVWVLVIPALVSASLKTFFSHVVFSGPKMRIRWEKETVHDIIHFGKWIFISSSVTFLTARLDLLIIGFYFPMRELGLYAIASKSVLIIVDAVSMLSGKVLIPLYSLMKRFSLNEIRKKVFRIRFALMAFALPPLYLLTFSGQEIINFIYPETYHDAGWMLQILAIGGIINVITKTIGPILLAMGDSFRLMITKFSQSIIMLLAMIIGGNLFGPKGLIIAASISQLFNYPILVMNIKRYGVWLPYLDFFGFAISATVIALKMLS